MKKRLATLAIVGAMAVAAMAPATVFAAPSQHRTTVQYVNGAVVPDGSNGTYYVLVPSNITFTDTTKSAAQNLELRSTAGGTTLTDLPSNLAISVNVQSKNGALLTTSGGYTSLKYTVDYGGGKTLNQDTGANTDLDLGQLTINAPKINGTATLTDGQTVSSPKGTIYQDTLTYTIEQEEPTVGP